MAHTARNEIQRVFGLLFLIGIVAALITTTKGTKTHERENKGWGPNKIRAERSEQEIDSAIEE